MTINTPDQLSFIFNISLAVFIGGILTSLTHDWIKRGVNFLISKIYNSLKEWWIRRDPPRIEVFSLTKDSHTTNDTCLDLDQYLEKQPTLPTTNFSLAVMIKGKHRNILTGQNLILDLIDKNNLLNVESGTKMPGCPSVTRLINEMTIRDSDMPIALTLTVKPKKKFGITEFEFQYKIVGTKVYGITTLRVSTSSRPN